MTVKDALKEIIRLKGGSKLEAARELSVSIRTIDNWLKIDDASKRRDRGLLVYLEGVVNGLTGNSGNVRRAGVVMDGKREECHDA